VAHGAEYLTRPSSMQRYGLAVVSVAAALCAPLLPGRYNVRGIEFPLFLFAISVSAWYAGPAPATLTPVLSSLRARQEISVPSWASRRPYGKA
jgi:hypothetical protein